MYAEPEAIPVCNNSCSKKLHTHLMAIHITLKHSARPASTRQPSRPPHALGRKGFQNMKACSSRPRHLHAQLLYSGVLSSQATCSK
jgi:hypothetical protein